MEYCVCSVYDTKAEAFITPFFVPNMAMALRALGDAVRDREHMFGKHPEDYILFELGKFDDSTSYIDQLVPPRNCGLLSSLGETDISRVEPQDFVREV